MNRALGIINCNMYGDLLQGIARDRSLGAVPFGGRYRVLDFSLSSMVNSGIRTVGIIISSKNRSVLDHLGAGKEWYLDRKAGGLFILPSSNHSLNQTEGKINLEDLARNIELIEKDYSESVIICNSDQVLNIDFKEILNFHKSNEADSTLIYKKFNKDFHEEQGRNLSLDNCGKVSRMSYNSKLDQMDYSTKYYIDIVIIKRCLLLEIVENCKLADTISYMDLIDVIEENLGGLKVFAYPFEGYLGKIDSVFSYYKHNMDMLNPKIRKELFLMRNRIHTKIKDNPPTRYGLDAKVKNSLISSGCYIEGTVENSIISRGVIINKGTVIKDSIIMQKCLIGNMVSLENVILDKFVKINNGSVVKGKSLNPIVINKKAVV
ncbi:MAG: glucose-1-phosphate adenylyltransferase subunit GlgD [Eubacteriales bacterium]